MRIISFQQAAHRLRPTLVNPRLSQLIPEWIAHRHAEGHTERGVQAYKDKIGQFHAFAGDIHPREITEELVEDYRRDQMERCEASTARNVLTVLRSFCDWAVRKGYMDMNTAKLVAHPKVTPPNPDPLTREQIDQLLAICDQPPQSHKATWRRNRRAVYLMLYAGLRIAEVAGLEWRDIDLRRGTITIRKEIAKGKRARVVWIAEELEAELRAATRRRSHEAVIDQGETDEGQGKPLTVKSLAHIFERWLPTRGLTIHAHQLRKTFATELYLAGEEIPTIQRLLGHSDPKTTMRYIGASSLKERDAIMKLRFRPQAEPQPTEE